MKIYFDDDSVSAVVITMLRKAGHDVRTPIEEGLSGADDATHLRQAIRDGRTLVSGNHDDFQSLHFLLLEAQGHHFGIVIIRKDNDASRDMSFRGITNAMQKLGAAAFDLRDSFVILNQWR